MRWTIRNKVIVCLGMLMTIIGTLALVVFRASIHTAVLLGVSANVLKNYLFLRIFVTIRIICKPFWKAIGQILKTITKRRLIRFPTYDIAVQKHRRL